MIAMATIARITGATGGIDSIECGPARCPGGAPAHATRPVYLGGGAINARGPSVCSVPVRLRLSALPEGGADHRRARPLGSLWAGASKPLERSSSPQSREDRLQDLHDRIPETLEDRLNELRHEVDQIRRHWETSLRGDFNVRARPPARPTPPYQQRSCQHLGRE